MAVYGLKHATNQMKYGHMNYVLDWRENLKDVTVNPPDRHVALEIIKKSMPDDLAFEIWFESIYRLRKANKHAEYEKAIFDKLAEIKQENKEQK